MILAVLPLILAARVSTHDGEGQTVLRFERSIYLTDPLGKQVLVEPGLYAVTATARGSRLRLYPGGGAAPLTLATETTAHEETEIPLPLALMLSKEDEVHVALLLPERKALDARGSYSSTLALPSNPSPEWFSQSYHQAASERLKRAGRRQERWKSASAGPLPSWTDLDITTNLGANIYTSQLANKKWSAYEASPGANIAVSGFAIPGVESIDAVRLVVYVGFYQDTQISGQDDFGRVRVPMKLDHGSISQDRRTFSAVLAASTSGLPPGPAYLEVDYNRAGISRTIALGSVARRDSPSVTWLRYRLPPLYFVPEYAVYAGEVQIHVVDSGLGENVDSIVDPLGAELVFPPYWLLQVVSLQSSSDFIGVKPFLRSPCASARVPRQGYRTKMDPPASGASTMTYRLVGPTGMQPPGVQTFDLFSELEIFSGATEETFPALPVNPKYVDWLASVGLAGLCHGQRR